LILPLLTHPSKTLQSRALPRLENPRPPATLLQTRSSFANLAEIIDYFLTSSYICFIAFAESKRDARTTRSTRAALAAAAIRGGPAMATDPTWTGQQPLLNET
jgi:hypothetical protein